MAALDAIQHIVVLMLENRSFDSMLGALYPKSDGFDGLSGLESNPNASGNAIPVWRATGSSSDAMNIPSPDPGELFTDINTQLFGAPQAPSPPGVPEMRGFARNYQAQPDNAAGGHDPRSVMHYYTPEQLPVLSALAKQFAVSDRWHASAPCQTWPNRFFLHTGTANGYPNNSPTHFPYDMPTVFNRLDERGIANAWKIYFHDVPQSLTLSRLWPHLERFRLYEELRHDATQGSLPAYSFIEPRYFSDASLPNDQHPPHVVTPGEQLIADVYNALRAGPAWQQTLLIVIYDEHGGCYDHVPPPAAVPPAAVLANAAPALPFNFDRYGVRVPALIVSPYVRAGTVLRPPGAVPYDHTSVIATLCKRFGLAPLTGRDAAAPDLENALALDQPGNPGPQQLQALPYVPSPSDVARAKAMPPNSMQQALLELTRRLPPDVHAIDAHIAALAAGAGVTGGGVAADVASAVAEAKSRLEALFRTL